MALLGKDNDVQLISISLIWYSLTLNILLFSLDPDSPKRIQTEKIPSQHQTFKNFELESWLFKGLSAEFLTWNLEENEADINSGLSNTEASGSTACAAPSTDLTFYSCFQTASTSTTSTTRSASAAAATSRSGTRSQPLRFTDRPSDQRCSSSRVFRRAPTSRLQAGSSTWGWRTSRRTRCSSPSSGQRPETTLTKEEVNTSL